MIIIIPDRQVVVSFSYVVMVAITAGLLCI